MNGNGGRPIAHSRISRFSRGFFSETERALQLFVPNWGSCDAVGGLKNMNGCVDREMGCKEVGTGKVTN